MAIVAAVRQNAGGFHCGPHSGEMRLRFRPGRVEYNENDPVPIVNVATWRSQHSRAYS